MATERTVLVRLKGDAGSLVRSLGTAQAAVRGLHNEIDKTNDRTAWLAQGFLALAPSLVPLGAAATPVLSGVATQLTLAAGAASVAALAFVGIGDALKAVNDYQMEPTTAHLEKMRQELDKIGPAGADFVMYLDQVGSKFSSLQMAAREGMFPGVMEGIDAFLLVLPRVRGIVRDVAEAMGQLASEAGAGISGSKFAEFFDYLERNAKPLLIEMGQTIGNFIDGLANMMVAFEPLTDSFSSGLLNMSRSFSEWSRGLDESSSFHRFVAYVQEAIPMVTDFLGSTVDAFVALAKAAAPVGEVMLPALTGLLDIITDLADTPLAPLVIGFAALTSAWGRLNALAQITGSGAVGKAFKGITTDVKALAPATASASGGLTVLARNAMTAGAASERMAAQNAAARSSVAKFGATAGPVAGQVGLLAISMSDLDDKAGLTNTAMLTLAGSMAGPWGAAVGFALGLTMDAASANDDLEASIQAVQAQLAAADGTTNMGPILDQVEALHASYDDFKSSVEDDVDFTSMSSVLGGIKNAVEDTFGRSDVEEFAEDIKAAEIESQILAGTWKGNWFQKALGLGTRGQQDLGTAIAQTTAKAQRWSPVVQQQIQDMRASRSAAREAAKQFIGLGDSLDDAKVSLGDWLKQLEKQADALRNFRLNAEKAADRGLRQGLIKALEEAGPAGALRMKQLANATDAEIDRANAAWKRGQREIKRYTDAIGGVPSDVYTEAHAETEAARRRLYELNAIKLDDKTIYVHTVRLGGGEGGADFVSGGVPSARGNIFAGDIANRHQPVLAGPGVTRVWREPETQGEAYIPLANDDRRPRARSIAEKTIELLGGAVAWNARGSLNAPGASYQQARTTHTERVVVETLPRGPVKLVMDGQEITAHFVDVARAEMAADRRFDNNRPGGARSGRG